MDQPITITPDFSVHDHALIRVSQSHADYIITLTKDGAEDSNKTISFSARKGLDEIILVSRHDCDDCTVVIQAADEVDRASFYSISLENLSDLSQNSDRLNDHIDVLENITSAAHFRYLADQARSEERKQFLSLTAKHLEKAVKSGNSSLDAPWRLHALLLLAETLSGLGDDTKKEATLKHIVDETEGTPSAIRAHALYELAPLNPNTQKQRKLYSEGMAIGELLNNDRLIAKGANYKATSLVRAGRFEEALHLLQKAYTIYSDSRRWRDVLDPLHNLSWANMRAGNFPASIAYATEFQLLAEAYADDNNAIWALYDLATTYGQMGERHVADQFIDQALEKIQALPMHARSPLVNLKGYLLQEKAHKLLQYGAFDLAKDYAQKAKAVFTDQNIPNRVIDILFIEGEIAIAQQELATAKALFLEILQHDKRNNRVGAVSKTYLRLAELETINQGPVQATPLLVSAIGHVIQTEDNALIAETLSKTVKHLYDLGAAKDAQDLIDDISNFVQHFALERHQARFLFHKAQVASSLNEDDDALRYLEAARVLVEVTLPKVRRRDLRQSYFALQKSIFEMNVALVLRSEKSVLSALQLVESFKGRTLEETIRDVSVDKTMSVEHRQRRKAIHQKIKQNALRWYSLGADQSDSLLSDTRSLSSDLEKLEAEIAGQRTSNSVLAKPLQLTDIVVGENELIAYYFVGKSESWLWVLAQNHISVHSLPPVDDMEELVKDAVELIATSPTERKTGGAWEQNRAIVNASKIILGPLEKTIQTLDITRVSIIPDGPLHSLPFAAMQLANSKRPIILDYELSYAASMGAKNKLSSAGLSHSETKKPSALIVIDSPERQADNNFSKLNYAQAEAKTIQSFLGSSAKVLRPPAAAKDRLLAELANSHSILHFSTHGLLNEDVPALSGLLMPSAASGDTLWLTPEISSTTIDAELVVLSACDSSAGRSVVGEGLFSLSRAFIEGGANQVLAAQWKIQDKASSVLIDHFYHYLLGEQLSVPNALRKAQAAIFLSTDFDWTDPYYWAGFQLHGGGEV